MIRGFFTSVGIGAGLMYFLDPQQGSRRREQTRDQFHRFRNSVVQARNAISRDIRQCTTGLVSEVRSLFQHNGHHSPSPRTQESLEQSESQGVSSFQGNEGPGVFREDWNPSTEFWIGAAAAGFVLYGLIRGAPSSSILGGAAIGMLVQRAFQESNPPQPSGQADVGGSSRQAETSPTVGSPIVVP